MKCLRYLFIVFNLYSFPKVQLSEIDFSKLKTVKATYGRGKNRGVYRDPDTNLYYKKWERNFGQRHLFLEAMQNGFYDEYNTPLVALIFDEKNICRGYIASPGQKTACQCKQELKFDQIRGNGFTFRPFAALSKQTDQRYINFYKDLLERTKQHKIAYIDYAPYNVIFINGQFKLIDLESIQPLDRINRFFFSDSWSPHDYRISIAALAHRRALKPNQYKLVLHLYRTVKVK